MAGIEKLWRLQMGLETTPGTPVAATLKWPGPAGALQDKSERTRVREDLGQHIAPLRSYRPFLAGALEMPEQPVSFEALPYILACGVKNVVTGVPDGTGSGKVYEFIQPVDGGNSIKTATLQAGDNQQARRMEYSFVEKFGLSGAVRDVWKMTAAWVGRQVSAVTFTGGLTAPVVEYALFQKTKAFLDDSGGTIGTTEVSSSLLAVSLEWTTGWAACYTAGGQLYFYEPEYLGAEITGKLTLRHDTVGEAELLAAENGDVRLLQLVIEGSTLQTEGTYSHKTIKIEAAILYDEVAALNRQDGRSVIELPFTVGDSDSIAPTITVVNEVAAL